MTQSLKVDTVCWAIKSEKTGALVEEKFHRTMWKIKPTNAINTLKWKAKTFYNKDLNIVPVKVRILEIEE